MTKRQRAFWNKKAREAELRVLRYYAYPNKAAVLPSVDGSFVMNVVLRAVEAEQRQTKKRKDMQ